MNPLSTIALDKPKKGGPTVFWFLVGLGVLLLLSGLVWLAANWLATGQGNTTLPPSLAGLPLTEQVSGQSALVEIERLHGKNFPLVAGAVAHYGGDAATVWLSATGSPALTAGQVVAMTERIAGGGSPFTPVSNSTVEGVTVYTLTGMGQTHYYFQFDRRVIWLAISPEQAEPGLLELIRYLR